MKKLPKTLYVEFKNDTGRKGDGFLSVADTAQNMLDEPGESKRVGVYELTGYVQVDGRISVKPTK